MNFAEKALKCSLQMKYLTKESISSYAPTIHQLRQNIDEFGARFVGSLPTNFHMKGESL